MNGSRLSIVFNAAVIVLLLVLVFEAAGIRRSVRRMQRHERSASVEHNFKPSLPCVADRLWQNPADARWVLVGPAGACSACCGPFGHRFFTRQGCEGALAEWNAALNESRVRQATGFIPLYGIGVLGKCEAHPLRP